MATTLYEKIGFVNRSDSKPDTYLVNGTPTNITKDNTGILTAGTPLNADNLNHLEQGIADSNTGVRNLEKVVSTMSGCLATTNQGNAYATTLDGITSLPDGIQIRVKFNAASTDSTTLNLNGFGPKAIVDYFGNPVKNIRQGLIANLAYNADTGNFILQGKGGGGNATSADLLNNKTATVDSGQIVGTIQVNTSARNSQASNKTTGNYDNVGQCAYLMPPKGYYDGTAWVYSQEPDLSSGNIRAGKNIFGISGSPSVVDTSDANALPNQIRNGQFAYVNGAKITGTLPVRATSPQTVMPGINDQIKSAGIYDGDIAVKGDSNLKPENILKDVPIFGVVGNVTVESIGGKKYASGSQIPNMAMVSDYSAFNLSTSARSNYTVFPAIVLNLKVLGFTPSIVIIYSNNTGYTFYTYVNTKKPYIFAGNTYYGISFSNKNIEDSYLITSECIGLTATDLANNQMRVAAPVGLSNMNLAWEAYE